MMITLTAHCQWKDETVRERTGHPLLYAEAKKVKLLTLHKYDCPRASIKVLTFFNVDLLDPILGTFFLHIICNANQMLGFLNIKSTHYSPIIGHIPTP